MRETDSNDRKSGFNTARQSDGTFGPGNPGKPKGARHKATVAVETLLEGEAETITKTAIDLAKGGDMTAIRLVLDRIAPARKSSPIKLELPTVKTATDLDHALSAVVEAVAEGEVSPDEGATVAGLLEAKRRSLETVDMDERLRALEERLSKK